MFELGTKVKQKSTGKIGVVVKGYCGLNEAPVEFEGESSLLGVDKEDLESLGSIDAKADLKKCGAGQGARCCIFITMNSEGLSCERFTSMRPILIFEKMNAKRQPSEPYPECQIFD